MMTLLRMAALPVPTHTMSGFDSATAMAPIDPVSIWPSPTGVHSAPQSVVFHTPPPVAPR